MWLCCIAHGIPGPALIFASAVRVRASWRVPRSRLLTFALRAALTCTLNGGAAARVASDAQALDAPANQLQGGCISGVVLSYTRWSDDAVGKVIRRLLCCC
jgi:hypothetical protein